MGNFTYLTNASGGMEACVPSFSISGASSDQPTLLRRLTCDCSKILYGSCVLSPHTEFPVISSIVVRVRSAFLVRCGGIGPSTAFLANQAPVYCGCPVGTHGCDLVSRVRLDQSANPVVVVVGSRVACCEVIAETWSFRTLVFVFPHSSSARSSYGLADSGVNTGTHPPRSHRHSIDVHRHLTSTLRSCWIRCHAVIVVLTASVAQHRRLLTLHFHWHVDNLVARTGPAESLARYDFGHVRVLATESHGYQVDSSCFDHSPVVPKSHQGWA